MKSSNKQRRAWRGTLWIPSKNLRPKIKQRATRLNWRMQQWRCDCELSRIRGWTTSARRMVQPLPFNATATAATATAMTFSRVLEGVVSPQCFQFANRFLGLRQGDHGMDPSEPLCFRIEQSPVIASAGPSRLNWLTRIRGERYMAVGVPITWNPRSQRESVNQIINRRANYDSRQAQTASLVSACRHQDGNNRVRADGDTRLSKEDFQSARLLEPLRSL